MLRQLGDFPTHQTVLLRGRSVDEVREALLSVNERIRGLREEPDVQADFLVMLGANPWESNGSLCTAPDFPGCLREIQARGGRSVVIDPCRTRTAQQADEQVHGEFPVATLADEITTKGPGQVRALCAWPSAVHIAHSPTGRGGARFEGWSNRPCRVAGGPHRGARGGDRQHDARGGQPAPGWVTVSLT